MESLLRNLRFSFRMLLKNPGLTLTILLTLALGVGANTAIFTVDYATLLQPLPYPNPDQLVVVWSKIQGFHNGMSAGDFTDWKRENTTFQDMNAWTGGAFNLSTKDQPEQIDGRMVTPGFYRMLGSAFFLGRDFLPEEGQTGRDHEVILTHKLWKRLGANPNIVGQTLKVNAEPYTVVGVLAPGLYDRGQGDIVVPLAFKPEQLNHDFHWLLTIGRLKPGVTIEQARADMDAVTAHIAQQYPKSNKGWSAFVEPLKNDFIPKERIRTLWMLLGAVAFVLLIACVNVANLLLARSMARQKEMAVRSSLGATPRAIFAQLLTESVLLALMGGALGIGVGYAMLHGFMAAMPEGTLPSEADLSLNFPVLLFTLAATTLSGLLFGCVPAWHASRVDPAETLKEGGRSGTGVGRKRLRQALAWRFTAS
jgi:putative ABC transport system permease protein